MAKLSVSQDPSSEAVQSQYLSLEVGRSHDPSSGRQRMFPSLLMFEPGPSVQPEKTKPKVGPEKEKENKKKKNKGVKEEVEEKVKEEVEKADETFGDSEEFIEALSQLSQVVIDYCSVKLLSRIFIL